MSVHLVAGETWTECPDPTICSRFIHVDYSLDEVQHVPAHILGKLIEAFDPPTRVDEEGTRMWLNDRGQLHREHDLPARIGKRGTKTWHRDGLIHRDNDLPARIDHNGGMEWRQHG